MDPPEEPGGSAGPHVRTRPDRGAVPDEGGPVRGGTAYAAVGATVWHGLEREAPRALEKEARRARPVLGGGRMGLLQGAGAPGPARLARPVAPLAQRDLAPLARWPPARLLPGLLQGAAARLAL